MVKRSLVIRIVVIMLTLIFTCTLGFAADPTAPAAGAMKAAGQKVEAARKELIDINTASKEQLKSVPGVGDAYAQKIIDGRPYAKKNQLLSKKVVPKTTYDKIKDLIVAKQPKRAGQDVHSTSSRSVIINGKHLSDQDIDTLARTFQVQARDGRYWYDRMNGSWGREGGPAEGFIMAGLNLGGPLRADASNGDTGVFINGRQLHRVDVARLMQLGPVYKGRCWMDAYGNIGLEGQPAFANIWIASAQAQGVGRKREGILSTYDKTGVAVFGY